MREENKRQIRRSITKEHGRQSVRLDSVYDGAGGICAICGLPVPVSVDENDMWSVIVFHKDALCNTIYYEVSYFDNNIRRDDFIEAVKLNLQRVKVDFAIYVGNTHMFSYGTLFEE